MPEPDAPLITASKITCIKEERILFEELSFEINAGEIVQVEGPNGAGKTSLLRILAGLSQPYSGQVMFQQFDIEEDPETYRQNLTYLGHQAGVKGELTSQENLEFYLKLHSEPVEVAEKRLAQVNLLGFEDSLASHLSAGQHRRTSLARLWQSHQKVWILDEPFTAIDKQGVKNLEQRFVEHAQNGGCVILTTHQDIAIDELPIRKITLEYRLF